MYNAEPYTIFINISFFFLFTHSDIYIWDLITLTGVCKLRGHKDAVTGLGFVDRGGQKLVVSVSKDTLLKVVCYTLRFVRVHQL